MKYDIKFKVIELRNYFLKPGTLDGFIDHFDKYIIDALVAVGSYPVGQFKINSFSDRIFNDFR